MGSSARGKEYDDIPNIRNADRARPARMTPTPVAFRARWKEGNFSFRFVGRIFSRLWLTTVLHTTILGTEHRVAGALEAPARRQPR